MKKPKRVLLDQWHVDVYIAPTKKLKKKDIRVLRILMGAYLNTLTAQITNELGREIDIVISQ